MKLNTIKTETAKAELEHVFHKTIKSHLSIYIFQNTMEIDDNHTQQQN